LPASIHFSVSPSVTWTSRQSTETGNNTDRYTQIHLGVHIDTQTHTAAQYVYIRKSYKRIGVTDERLGNQEPLAVKDKDGEPR